jgi:hypothetical protein
MYLSALLIYFIYFVPSPTSDDELDEQKFFSFSDKPGTALRLVIFILTMYLLGIEY